MRWCTSWLVVLAAGCAFTPPEGVLRCDPVTACPPSFVCRADNFCWRSALGDGGDAGTPDAGVDAPALDAPTARDLGTVDAAVVDSGSVDSGSIDSGSAGG
jgi:hypothetical protein